MDAPEVRPAAIRSGPVVRPKSIVGVGRALAVKHARIGPPLKVTVQLYAPVALETMHVKLRVTRVARVDRCRVPIVSGFTHLSER